MKKVTVQEVIDAIRQNGKPQAFGAFYRSESGNPTGAKTQAVTACALGQAAINLKVPTKSLVRSLSKIQNIKFDGLDINLDGLIISLNDTQRWNLEQISNYLEETLPEDTKERVLE